MHSLLKRARAAIETEIAGMTPADLDRHPPGKWSSAGILEHLAITFEGTRRNFQKCLDTGERRAGRPTFSQRLAVLSVVELGRFPEGVQAPERTLPTGVAPQAAVDAVRRNFEAMDRVIEECATRFGSHRVIANHPILGPLSVRQWRRFHWVHVRHHMKQIRRLRSTG